MSVPDAAPESCFVDTNIWLYAFIEGEDRQKTARAKELLEASRTLIVSTQVINEVCVNLLKKETIASVPGFGMAPEGHLSYSAGLNMRARRTQPCSVRGRIDPIPLKGFLQFPTCHRQRSSLPVAPPRVKRVHVVGIRLIETSSTSGPCTTWGILTYGVRVISWSPIRSTTVRSVASTLTRTFLISHHPVVSTPTA